MTLATLGRILAPSFPPFPVRLVRFWTGLGRMAHLNIGVQGLYLGLGLTLIMLPVFWLMKLAAAAYGLMAYLMWVWLVCSVWSAIALPWYLVTVAVRLIDYLLHR